MTKRRRRKRQLPELIAVNRYGARFGRSRKRTRYHSGKLFRSYYTHVCLRCGWAFKPPRHLAHRMIDCDLVVAQLRDRDTRKFVEMNLYGA